MDLAPTQGPASQDEEYLTLADELIRTMVGIRRVMGPPADHEPGHHQRLDEVGRGGPGLIALLAERGDPMSPSAIAHELGLSPARVSNILVTLEETGVIIREPDAADRRRVVVSLTDRGREIGQARAQAMEGYAAGLLAELGEADARELVRIIERVRDVLELHRRGETTGEGVACPCAH